MRKSLCKFGGGEPHPTQHPLNDVAVMAQQSPRFARVVAVICAYLAPFKWAEAYGALVALHRQQRSDLGVVKPGSTFTLCRKDFGFTAQRTSFFLGLGHRRLRMLTPAFPCFGLSIVKPTPGFYFRLGVILSATRAFSFQMFKSAFAVVFKVRLPFFRGTHVFSHANYPTQFCVV